MNDDRKSLGARLREAREYLGLSQDEVARVVALPRPAISMVERGQRKVDALELKKFAELYQRPVAEFTGEVDADNLMPEAVRYIARAASKLTDDDRAELVRFAEFLSSRSTRKRGG